MHRIAILAIAALGVAACQQVQAPDDVLESAFLEAAFERQGADDLQRDDPADGRLVRWETPIFAMIETGVTGPDRLFIEQELARFSALTKVPVSMVSDVHDANLRISIDPDFDFAEVGLPFADCIAQTNVDDGRIESAVIVIGDVLSRGIQQCVRHEMMHAFGFSGHTHRLNSVLSYFHSIDDLTQADHTFLRVLYDDGFTAGMSRAEVKTGLTTLLRRYQ